MSTRGDKMHALMIFLRQLLLDLYFPWYLIETFLGALIVSLIVYSIVKIKVVRSHRAR